eukprot:COSAG01_NODE_73447_length_245_cov_3.630137_1_plen_30_part_01
MLLDGIKDTNGKPAGFGNLFRDWVKQHAHI